MTCSSPKRRARRTDTAEPETLPFPTRSASDALRGIDALQADRKRKARSARRTGPGRLFRRLSAILDLRSSRSIPSFFCAYARRVSQRLHPDAVLGPQRPQDMRFNQIRKREQRGPVRRRLYERFELSASVARRDIADRASTPEAWPWAAVCTARPRRACRPRRPDRQHATFRALSSWEHFNRIRRFCHFSPQGAPIEPERIAPIGRPGASN